ncbi:MAG TPA: NAD(P)H-binding protein [Vicinamibacterales bacterium]|nr:NAD(P)H-binding protein [Vicinamibacterales bacterium]
MHRILVVGATGNVGRHVVEQLRTAGAPFRAMTRNPDAAGFPPDVDVVAGDLTIPESLDRALEGVETVFLVWTAPPAAAAGALERIATHARRIVFLTSPLKTPHPFFQQPNPSRETAERVERLIEASGLEWTFLRAGMFAGNVRHFWGPQIRAGAVVRWPYLDAPTAPTDERDVAAAAVRLLCEDGHAGAEYVVTGPQSLTQAEQIHTIGRAIGRPLRVEAMSPEAARSELLPVLGSPVFIDMLLNAWAAAVGQPAYVTSTYAELTGTPPRTFLEWATDHAAEFRG